MHLFIRYEVIQPILSELRYPTHLEEIRRLHVSTNLSSLFFCSIWCLGLVSGRVELISSWLVIFANVLVTMHMNLVLLYVNCFVFISNIVYSAISTDFTRCFLNILCIFGFLIHQSLSSQLTCSHRSLFTTYTICNFLNYFILIFNLFIHLLL